LNGKLSFISTNGEALALSLACIIAGSNAVISEPKAAPENIGKAASAGTR
jgi:hypothetical protein